MSQAHSQGERIGLGVVEGFAEGHQVKFDQHPPQGEGLVGQPADEKGENYDSDGAGHFGSAAVAASLTLRFLGGTPGCHAAHNAPAQDKPQQEEVAHRDDNKGNHKTQKDLLCLIESQQNLGVPMSGVGVREANQAELIICRNLET